MKSSIWKKEIWPERVDAFLMCLGLALVPLTVGVIALVSSDRKLIAASLLAFGLMSIAAGIGILKQVERAPKFTSALFALQAIFTVVIGDDGIVGITGAIPSLLGVYYFYNYEKDKETKFLR